MTREIRFTNKNDEVWFKYFDHPPATKLSPPKKKDKGINLAALSLYLMYRTAIFNSYTLKPDLTDDITSYKKQYDSTLALSQNLQSIYHNPVHHYSVKASLDAMNDWLDRKQEMKCYLAYQNVEGCKKIVGFVHFQEKTMNRNSFVYIAQIGVTNRSCGIGTRLMECVLSHYPGNTHFKILTRAFNTEAKSLYQDKMNFSPFSQEEVHQLGYDNKYCGFKYTTSCDQVEAIKKKIEDIDNIKSTPSLRASSLP